MNWAMDNFKDDRYGRFRRHQVSSLVDIVINCLQQS